MHLKINKYLAFGFAFVILLSVLTCAQAEPDTTKSDSTTSGTQITPEAKSNTILDKFGAPKPAIKKWSISFTKVFWAIIIFLIAFLIIKFVTKVLETIAEKSAKMRLSVKRIIPIFRIFGWTFVIWVVIEGIFAPPIETLIAVTGAAGIAIGFASQDILKNIFGGIMILFDRPFQVGDKIQVGAHYGEVVNIGLRTVRIVTPDDSLVSVPNNEMVNQSVSNSNSGEFNCQVVAEFFLPPDIEISKVKQLAQEAAAVSRYVYLNKPIAVIIKNEIHQGRSLLKMRLKAYVLDIRYEFAFMSEMTEIVMQELILAGLVEPKAMAFLPGHDSKTSS